MCLVSCSHGLPVAGCARILPQVWDDLNQEFVADDDLTMDDDTLILLIDADTKVRGTTKQEKQDTTVASMPSCHAYELCRWVHILRFTSDGCSLRCNQAPNASGVRFNLTRPKFGLVSTAAVHMTPGMCAWRASVRRCLSAACMILWGSFWLTQM